MNIIDESFDPQQYVDTLHYPDSSKRVVPSYQIRPNGSTYYPTKDNPNISNGVGAKGNNERK